MPPKHPTAIAIISVLTTVNEGAFNEPFAGYVGEPKAGQAFSAHRDQQRERVRSGIANVASGDFDERGEGYNAFKGYRAQMHHTSDGAQHHTIWHSKSGTRIANVRAHRGGELHVDVLHPGQTSTGNYVKVANFSDAAKAAIHYHKNYVETHQ